MSELKELLLREPRLTLAVAESLTCGNLQSHIGRISGASNFFLGGITAYSLEQKVRHLGVDRAGASEVNCVSAAVAEQMARGVATLFGADIALATTGYAEPLPEQGVKVPFAWWALAHRSSDTWRVQSARIECHNATRVQVQAQVTVAAITGLLEYLRANR
ncbi:MAG: CinA family protein [Cephaloticoccus sp.]|nr:CinA family protein [Cephaloticoccus sp.]MCF7761230.1 CinA family protein [Cephaloticoccus sp.]